MVPKFCGQSLYIAFDTLLRLRMCESCRWAVGLDEGQELGILCRRCRVYPKLAAEVLRRDEERRCWQCNQVDHHEQHTANRVCRRRDVICSGCLLAGIDLANALEYVEGFVTHRFGTSDS